MAPGVPAVFFQGSATVSVAPVGVPPTGLRTESTSVNRPVVDPANVFGETQKTAGRTPALPNSTESFRLNSSGRRLALAHWLTSSNNPIVARVLVNRIWRYHFGQGLVSTVDNLGQSGARPVCPELLDWLASELIESGWSLKHLHRLILSSAAWRQRADPTTIDLPITRSQPQRLDAESLRDAMLAVSGELDLKAGGPYVPTKTDKLGQIVIDEKQAGAFRRSLYLQQRRTHPVDFLATFDGPAHNPVCVQRVTSTVALQSLSLLNSEFVHLRARAFAKRLMQSAAFKPPQSQDEAARKTRLKSTFGYAFELAYGRQPRNEELSAAEDFIREQGAIYKNEADADLRVWTDFCQMLLASNAFLYVD